MTHCILIVCTVMIFIMGASADAKPLRIIALAPNLTEIVYALGAEHQLVGVIGHSDYPPQAKKMTRVGNYQSLNIEKILSLKPDLILSWSAGNPPQQLATLRSFQIPMVDVSPTRLNQLAPIILKIANRIHRPKQGKKLAAQLTKQLAQLRQTYQNKPRVKIFYQIWHQPLMTVAAHTWLNDAIQVCGGKNIFADSPVRYPQVNIEQVLSRHPKLIILGKNDAQGALIWKQWGFSPHQFIRINSNLMDRFTPRLLKGVKQLCQSIDSMR